MLQTKLPSLLAAYWNFAKMYMGVSIFEVTTPFLATTHLNNQQFQNNRQIWHVNTLLFKFHFRCSFLYK